jgi:hypothetical protein
LNPIVYSTQLIHYSISIYSPLFPLPHYCIVTTNNSPSSPLLCPLYCSIFLPPRLEPFATEGPNDL